MLLLDGLRQLPGRTRTSPVHSEAAEPRSSGCCGSTPQGKLMICLSFVKFFMEIANNFTEIELFVLNNFINSEYDIVCVTV